MNERIAIQVAHLSKEFRIPHEQITTVRGAFVNLFKKKTYEKFLALDDVSFEVKKGEFFGIIGRNGSGKSTLLKILAGIYQPGSGTINVSGLISPFLELGIGFNPELSGRDNIYLNAAVLGLTKKQIDKKFNQIVQFSELERFIDQKIKNYSSGMQVRLAFSVAIHANREILLMDEVLAVGDANFQEKCIEEFNSYRDVGKTVVLVSHDLSTIQRYCDRALLLRNGKIMRIGDPDDVVKEYVYQNMSDEERRLQTLTHGGSSRSTQKKDREKKPIRITYVEFLNAHGEVKNLFRTGDEITARIFFEALTPLDKPVIGVAIHTRDGIHITGPNTKTSKFQIDRIAGKGSIDFHLHAAPLFAGQYDFTAALYNWDCTIPYDIHDRAYRFKMLSHEINQYGLIKVEHTWTLNT